MKLITILSLVLAANSVLANAVGIQKSDITEAANKPVTLALSENDTSNRWAVEPLKFEATAHQVAELNKEVEKAHAQMSQKLDALIAEKLEQSLQY